MIPLGGVGEVGKNSTVVEYENDLILLDVGAKFPEDDQLGVDLIVPDVSYVKERERNLRGILITHGHEDHIGGLPYIMLQLRPKDPVPVYGSPLAIGLLDHKMRENRVEKYVDLRPVQLGQRIQFGKLAAEFIHVTHSIPDTNAIAVHSPVGTIIDTADFKFDPTPIMGKPTNERRLRKLGEAGVLALFSDTVRVESEGSTPSERVVYDTMRRVIERSKGQVIIATFASNISRLKMALDAAAEEWPESCGRRAQHGAELPGGAGARISRSGAGLTHLARRSIAVAARETTAGGYRQPGRASRGAGSHCHGCASEAAGVPGRCGDHLGVADSRQRGNGVAHDRQPFPAWLRGGLQRDRARCPCVGTCRPR